jgi:hypothetical protein
MAELYSPSLDIWFEDGLDTPGIALLRVTPVECEFWEPRHGKLATAAGMLKALGNAAIGGAGQGVHVGLARYNEHDLARLNIPCLLRIDKRLKICAAARNENGNFCLFNHGAHLAFR